VASLVSSSTTVQMAFVPILKTRRRPPYTVLSQHCRTAEVYEACKVHLRYGLCLRAPTVWVGGHVYPALFPRFSHHPRVRHSYTGN
jgi:hypothetical protein